MTIGVLLAVVGGGIAWAAMSSDDNGDTRAEGRAGDEDDGVEMDGTDELDAPTIIARELLITLPEAECFISRMDADYGYDEDAAVDAVVEGGGEDAIFGSLDNCAGTGFEPTGDDLALSACVSFLDLSERGYAGVLSRSQWHSEMEGIIETMRAAAGEDSAYSGIAGGLAEAKGWYQTGSGNVPSFDFQFPRESGASSGIGLLMSQCDRIAVALG